MTIFIGPIVIILMPLLQSLNVAGGGVPSQVSLLWMALMFLFPASIMAISLGNFAIGEEGQAVWRIYAAPVSPRNLVKSKYFVVVLFSLIIVAVAATIGFLTFHPSVRAAFVAIVEAIFLVFVLGAVSLSMGIKGADFIEVPRARMIRLEWGLTSFAACLLSATAILSPLLPYVLSVFVAGIGSLDPYLAVLVSAVVASVLAGVFYRVALSGAKKLLAKAES